MRDSRLRHMPTDLSGVAKERSGARSASRLVLMGTAGVAFAFVIASAVSAWHLADQAHWSTADFRWLPLLLVLGACSYFLRFLRWHLLATRLAPQLRLAASVRIYMAGFALGLTPGRLGEFAKFAFLKDLTGVDELRSAPIFPLERATEATSFLALALAGAIFGHLPLRNPGLTVLAVAAFLPGVAAGTVVLRWLLKRQQQTPSTTQGGLRALVAGTLDVAGPIPVCLALLCALLARSFDATLFWAAANGTGMSLSLAAAAFAFGLAGLAGGLSLMPGGVVAVEGALVATVVALGGNVGLGIAAALLARTTTLWLWVPFGLVFAVRFAFNRPSHVVETIPQPPA